MKWEYKPEVDRRFDTFTGAAKEHVTHWIQDGDMKVAIAVPYNNVDTAINAQLISAAPELFEALNSVFQEYASQEIKPKCWDSIVTSLAKAIERRE